MVAARPEAVRELPAVLRHVERLDHAAVDQGETVVRIALTEQAIALAVVPPAADGQNGGAGSRLQVHQEVWYDAGTDPQLGLDQPRPWRLGPAHDANE